jgi:hypothetical protein
MKSKKSKDMMLATILANKLCDLYPNESKESIIKYVYQLTKDIDTSYNTKCAVWAIMLAQTADQSSNHDIDLSGNTTPTDDNEGS